MSAERFKNVTSLEIDDLLNNKTIILYLVFYNFEAFLIKQLLHSLVGYEMIIANSALRASLAIYHLISNARSWNNC